jgi:protein gp37
MSDLFHEKVPVVYIRQVAQVMRTADWHTYQVLTKRATRLKNLLNDELNEFSHLSHIWWGVSVENRKQGLPRIDELQKASVSVRFLSIEPLLEDLGTIDLTGISWVIVGGESGPGAREMKGAWVRSIREQCIDANVPFFFKQWGGVHKRETGRKLDGFTYDELPVLTAMA